MLITFLVLSGFLAATTGLKPQETPYRPTTDARVDLEPAPWGKWYAGGIVAATAALYIVFW